MSNISHLEVESPDASTAKITSTCLAGANRGLNGMFSPFSPTSRNYEENYLYKKKKTVKRRIGLIIIRLDSPPSTITSSSDFERSKPIDPFTPLNGLGYRAVNEGDKAALAIFWIIFLKTELYFAGTPVTALNTYRKLRYQKKE
jgi:hypothetical protein